SGNYSDGQNGAGFVRTTPAYPVLESNATPSNTTCCGPFVFTGRFSDYAGLGLNAVYLEFDGTNYSANLSSGDVKDGFWNASVSVGSAGAVAYRWHGQNRDGNWNSSANHTFTVTASATPTPVVGTGSGSTPTPATPSSSSGGSTSIGVPLTQGDSAPSLPSGKDRNFGDVRFGTALVRGVFSPESATFQVTFTAGANGFTGELSERVPLDFADYQNGIVSFKPEPARVEPGSILATWDIGLSPGETFRADVTVAKAVPQSLLDEFPAPEAKPRRYVAPGSAEAIPVEVAGALGLEVNDYTLWYMVGGLVLLGLAGYALASGRKKKR
ncbi:MAG: hypothetical protein Q8P02_00095, partial [Candidatus Micrarchaeota archaeon]|nr:hypothetical protein [Candidatus Micrarchaeota archaeon]